MNESGFIEAGAVSRESIVVTSPSGVRMTMKPPPPMPAENGSVTPSTAAEATAASTALPPARKVSIAACVPSASTVAAAPPEPVAVGVFAGSCAPAPCAPASAASRPAHSSARRNGLRLIGPPQVRRVGETVPPPSARHAQQRRARGLAGVLAQPRDERRPARQGGAPQRDGDPGLRPRRELLRMPVGLVLVPRLVAGVAAAG